MTQNHPPFDQPTQPSTPQKTAIINSFQIPSQGADVLQGWTHTPPNPRGVMLMVHGVGEHSGRYSRLHHALEQAGIAIVRYDLRGHGQSGGARGTAESYDQMLDDISAIAEYAQQVFPNQPKIIFGHSLGGNLVANWVLRRQNLSRTFSGMILSSPWLRLVKQPGAFQQSIARAIAAVFPNFPLGAKFDPRRLTRETSEVQAYLDDPLVHTRLSARLAVSAFDAAKFALNHAGEIPIPSLCLHGELDTITSPSGTVEFAEKAPHSTLHLFSDTVHEPHNDLHADQATAFITDWVSGLLKN